METLIGVTALVVGFVISILHRRQSVMIKIPVYLRDMYDAKHLVQAASGCRKDVELICGRYIVDAKSMLGVFSLPTFDNVEIGAEEEDVKET